MRKLALVFGVISSFGLASMLPLAKPAIAGTANLGSGYARIDNYTGFRSGVFSPPDSWTGPFWARFIGVPDFESNSDPCPWYPYLYYNTNSIRTSLRTTQGYYPEKRSLWFETSGPVVVNESYSALRSTDASADGHVYTKAVFDWTTEWNFASAKCLRLELWPGYYPGISTSEPIWSVQPGVGLHSGHVEIEFPETCGISFRLAAVTPTLVPEPASFALLFCGVLMTVMNCRKRARAEH